MKKTNIILIILLLIGFSLGIIGAILKVVWGAYPDIYLLLALIISTIAICGLVLANYKKILK